jgi:CopG family transcriptional regulator/antitoxin EndoAI
MRGGSLRTTKIISVSLPPEMVEQAEALAKEEHRTMSELIREALRRYQRERNEWQSLFEYGRDNARKLGISRDDQIVRRVRDFRRRKREKSAGPRQSAR